MEYLTAMICSAIPSQIDCRAVWSRGDSKTLVMTVDQNEFKYRQSFVNVGDGFAVEQGLLLLPQPARRQGLTKRLMRNLVIVYDHLNVRHVSTYANDIQGALVWAKLGARPLDPGLQRYELVEYTHQNVRNGKIDRALEAKIVEIINNTPENELMYRVAGLVTEGGLQIGELLLLNHGWAAYWDLHDPALRTFLRETLI